MNISDPCMITSRLLPGLRVGDGEISIDYSKEISERGCVWYRYYIDVGKRHLRGYDIRSGVGGGNLQDGLAALLSFLTAAADSYRVNGRTMGDRDSNARLFPTWVTEWAYQHQDELSYLGAELNETKGTIDERGGPDGTGERAARRRLPHLRAP